MTEQVETNAGSVPRRTIIKGAAWSVPIVALATAAPSAAANSVPCTPTTRTFTAALPEDNTFSGSASRTTPFQVPAGVNSITFIVAGAAGGGPGGPTGAAGLGGLVTGTLAVTPLENLTLIVGQGGWADAPTITSTDLPAIEGGQGYGNGGDVAEVPATLPSGVRSQTIQGGSGGGGSAILSSGVPLVVAGGGGGRQNAIWELNDWNWIEQATGGDGGQPGSEVTNAITRVGYPNSRLRGGAGAGGVGATPGLGGVGSWSGLPAGVTNVIYTGASGSGRNGGDGAMTTIGGGNAGP